MKSRTLILPAVVSWASLSLACNPSISEPVTDYFINWGVITEDDIPSSSSGGGGGGGGTDACTEMALLQDKDPFTECIEPFIVDVNFKKLKLRATTTKTQTRQTSDRLRRRQAFECESNEVCSHFPAASDQTFCLDPATGDWHEEFGGFGSFKTGDFHDNDGTEGNFYEAMGVDPPDPDVFESQASNSGADGSDGGDGSGSGSGSKEDDDSAAVRTGSAFALWAGMPVVAVVAAAL